VAALQVKTVLWWVSNLLVLVGTGSYSVVKSIDMKKKHEISSLSATTHSTLMEGSKQEKNALV